MIFEKQYAYLAVDNNFLYCLSSIFLKLIVKNFHIKKKPVYNYNQLIMIILDVNHY